MSSGHWLALQSFAWVRMTIQFSEHDSLGHALVKTFSGRHPCQLCLTVQNGFQQEKQQEQKLPWLQTERLPEVVWELRCLTAPPVPTAAREQSRIIQEFYTGFLDSPPTPPPRT